jgi:23S rRNA (pseudouridine1915-N3)-methyltransferase
MARVYLSLELPATPLELPHEVRMKSIRILAVGPIKTPHWRDAAAHYKKRLSHFLRLEEIEIKDADAGLPPKARVERESSRLLGLVRPPDIAFCLDERGTGHDSRSFADVLRRVYDAGKRPCFIIGGAYGLAETVRTAAAHCLSLGPMTFPHELARVILLEQIYRAESILAGAGYHH